MSAPHVNSPITIPSRAPDFIEPPYGTLCTVQVWHPAPGEVGVVTVSETEPKGYHSPACEDVRAITRALSDTPLQRLYNHLGATMQHTTKGGEHTTVLGLGDPEFINARGRMLPLPEEHRLPSFLRFDGSSFKVEDGCDALFNSHSFLMGMDKDYLAHDWMHLLGGLLLLSPLNVARIKLRLERATARDEIADIFVDLDESMLPEKLASQAADALVIDHALSTGSGNWKPKHADQQWTRAGEVLLRVAFGGNSKLSAYELGQEFRTHCHALGRAALTLAA